MKSDFLKLTPNQLKKVSCIIFQGSNEAYINFCLDGVVELLGSITKESYTQEEFLSNPYIIQNQGNLFATASDSKLIVITNVSDKLYNSVVDLCQKADPSNIVILVPSATLKQAKIKTFLTNDGHGLMVNCYLNSLKDKTDFINSLAQRSGITLTQEAVLYLAEYLEDALDNLKTDIAKLKLYVDSGAEITLADVKKTLSINISNEVSELVEAVGLRHKLKIQEGIQKAEYNGFEALMVLRYLSIHFMKLLQLKALTADGTALSQAFMQIKPPIFFKLQDMYKKQIDLWHEKEILRLMSWLTKAEVAFKSGDLLHLIKIKKLLMSLGK